MHFYLRFFFFSLLLAGHLSSLAGGLKPKLYKTLRAYVASLPGEFEQIPAERKADLKRLGDYLLADQAADSSALLLFICTHNSRRSQMAQLWAGLGAHYYGVEGIGTYSGGTEATAFNPRAVAAMERAGFRMDRNSQQDQENPQYAASFSHQVPGLIAFSKTYDDPFNPGEDFAAVMVCSDADASCPFVPGAEARVALPYDDPRYYDGTPSETEKYDERCRMIAREMFFLMDYVKQQEILQAEASR